MPLKFRHPAGTRGRRLPHLLSGLLDRQAVSESGIIMITALMVDIGAGLGAVAFRCCRDLLCYSHCRRPSLSRGRACLCRGSICPGQSLGTILYTLLGILAALGAVGFTRLIYAMAALIYLWPLGALDWGTRRQRTTVKR